MSNRKLSFAALLVVAALSFNVRAETDPRDYAGISTLPDRTSLFLAYYRHQSTSDTQDVTQDIGIFRGVYIRKIGNLTIVPIDFFLPVAEATVYNVPVSATELVTLHASGIGDLTYLPTVIWEQPEGPGLSSVIGASLYITAPVGTYDNTKNVNIGNHRWTVKPEIALGQRFMKRYTFEILGNITFYTDNTAFNVPGVGLNHTLSQSATPGLEAHFMADVTDVLEMGASYYIFGNGRQSITDLGVPGGVTATGEQTIQTVRGTVGIRVEQRSIIYLQYNQDIHTNGTASIGRFWGARIAHAF
jgi:hypothetical protein